MTRTLEPSIEDRLYYRWLTKVLQSNVAPPKPELVPRPKRPREARNEEFSSDGEVLTSGDDDDFIHFQRHCVCMSRTLYKCPVLTILQLDPSTYRMPAATDHSLLIYNHHGTLQFYYVRWKTFVIGVGRSSNLLIPTEVPTTAFKSKSWPFADRSLTSFSMTRDPILHHRAA